MPDYMNIWSYYLELWKSHVEERQKYKEIIACKDDKVIVIKQY